MLLKQYRDCMNTFIAEMNAGEEVDFTEACSEESAKLALYVNSHMNVYQKRNPSTLSEKKQAYFTPMMPYFQDF